MDYILSLNQKNYNYKLERRRLPPRDPWLRKTIKMEPED